MRDLQRKRMKSATGPWMLTMTYCFQVQLNIYLGKKSNFHSK